MSHFDPNFGTRSAGGGGEAPIAGQSQPGHADKLLARLVKVPGQHQEFGALGKVVINLGMRLPRFDLHGFLSV